MRATEWLSDQLYTAPPMRKATVAAPFPYDLFFAFVLQIVTALTQCKPQPADGLAYLTWKPGLLARLFGQYHRQLSAHRAAVEALIARAWKDSATAFRAFCDSLWHLADTGALTEERARAVYQDVRGK